MNTLVQSLQPISSTYLHVRSKDGFQLESNFNTHFSINLASPIRCDPDQVINISMISASIPYSFYPISNRLDNDTIIYDDTEMLVLPTQNYDAEELVRIFNDDTAFSAIFTTTYSYYTNKIKFTNITASSHTLNWTLSNSVKVIGFVETPDQIILAGQNTSSTGMIDFATIHSVIIRSDIAQGNVLNSNGSNSTTLQKINIDSNPYGMVFLNATDIRQKSLSSAPSVDQIVFKLVDQNGLLLDLNKINYEFSLLFTIHSLILEDNGIDRITRQAITNTQPQSTVPSVAVSSTVPSVAVSSVFPSTFLPTPVVVEDTSRDLGHVIEETILDLFI